MTDRFGRISLGFRRLFMAAGYNTAKGWKGTGILIFLVLSRAGLATIHIARLGGGTGVGAYGLDDLTFTYVPEPRPWPFGVALGAGMLRRRR